RRALLRTLGNAVFLRGKSFGGARLGLGGFFFTILWRGGSFERMQQAQRDAGDFIDGGLEGFLVGLGGLVEAGDLSYELQRGRADFVFGYRRIEIEKRFDISAHRCENSYGRLALRR